MEEHCKICGSAFESIHGRKYCSEDCRKEAKREKGRKSYNKHKEERCEKGKIRREKRIAAGLCVYCGKNKPMEGKRRCFACALKLSQKYYEKKELIQREQCAEQKAMEDHERENV